LKRQGRAEEHLALFYPETEAEREELFKVMQKKTGLKLEVASISELIPTGTRQLSGADMEAVLVRTRFRALAQGREQATVEDLKAVFEDFVPPSYPLEIELQNLVAVQECTSRELLPESFRRLDRDHITRRVRELKNLLEQG
jgi:ATP-dependent 26S proteasome regulatory subunit